MNKPPTKPNSHDRLVQLQTAFENDHLAQIGSHMHLPQVNAHGGFGGEVGPTRGTLSTTPDAVINNLSSQLDRMIAKHSSLVSELKMRLDQEPATFLKQDLLNILNKH